MIEFIAVLAFWEGRAMGIPCGVSRGRDAFFGCVPRYTKANTGGSQQGEVALAARHDRLFVPQERPQSDRMRGIGN